MARDAPLPPTGTTVIDAVGSNPDDLLPGDSVQLVSAVGCAGEDCVLAEEALVMAIGEAEASSLGSNERQVSFAMKPHAAAAGNGVAASRRDSRRDAVTVSCSRRRELAREAKLKVDYSNHPSRLCRQPPPERATSSCR